MTDDPRTLAATYFGDQLEPDRQRKITTIRVTFDARDLAANSPG